MIFGEKMLDWGMVEMFVYVILFDDGKCICILG